MDYTARVLNYYMAAMMLLHLMACLSEKSYRQKRILEYTIQVQQ